MRVSDKFTSCNDFEIGKEISLYPSYAAVYVNEASLDKETDSYIKKTTERQR